MPRSQTSTSGASTAKSKSSAALTPATTTNAPCPVAPPRSIWRSFGIPPPTANAAEPSTSVITSTPSLSPPKCLPPPNRIFKVTSSPNLPRYAFPHLLLAQFRTEASPDTGHSRFTMSSSSSPIILPRFVCLLPRVLTRSRSLPLPLVSVRSRWYSLDICLLSDSPFAYNLCAPCLGLVGRICPYLGCNFSAYWVFGRQIRFGGDCPSSTGSACDASDLASQQRLVVECGSQVDENEDGYFWRKYGQKSVKGSSTPRQYYRCRVLNCSVKKTVEASPKGNTIVTYDGFHTHEPGVVVASPTVPAPAPPSIRAPLHQSHHNMHHHNMPVLQPQLQTVYTTVPQLPLMVKFEPESPSTSSPASSYPSSSVESPSSITDDEDSYFSEPSPKRTFKDEDVNYSEQIHQFAPEAPPAETWYALWDNSAELLTH